MFKQEGQAGLWWKGQEMLLILSSCFGVPKSPWEWLVRKAPRSVKLPGPLCPPTSFLWMVTALPSATQFLASLPYCIQHHPKLLFLLPCSQLNSYCLREQVPARKLTLESHSTKCAPCSCRNPILHCMNAIFIFSKAGCSVLRHQDNRVCMCVILNERIEVAECKSSACKAKY